MKKSYIHTMIVFSMCVSLLSCSKEDDNGADVVKPVIRLDEPGDGDSLLIGEGIHFECDFSDNVMLGSYLIEIHNDFDGHSHKVAATRTEDETPFFCKQSFSLEGLRNSHVHHHDIVIPENATPGKYHFVVYCTDEAGNQSMVYREVILSHDAHEHAHEDQD